MQLQFNDVRRWKQTQSCQEHKCLCQAAEIVRLQAVWSGPNLNGKIHFGAFGSSAFYTNNLNPNQDFKTQLNRLLILDTTLCEASDQSLDIL